MEDALVDRKSAPQEQPKPPNPASLEGDQTSARKYQNDQPHFPENEGLVGKSTREAADFEDEQGAEIEKERQAAAQRGRAN
jgi:hypothetical protein